MTTYLGYNFTKDGWCFLWRKQIIVKNQLFLSLQS